MNNKLSTLALASLITVSSTALLSESASALTITLDSINYEITTITGTYGDLQTDLETQPWWGFTALAESGADQVGDGLGFPNGLGPYFGYERTTLSTRGWAFDSEDNDAIGIGVFDPGGFSESRTWAIVDQSTSVPEPSTIIGLGTLIAFAFGTDFKRKLANVKKK